MRTRQAIAALREQAAIGVHEKQAAINAACLIYGEGARPALIAAWAAHFEIVGGG